ncbi:Iron only hydrogenase large subunit, C-terminal domain [Fervidobacterium changbaicum]|uniref:Ferredoxin n=1 Tax=Fervidobacterium changbaicum TaxID=310769 RepID=A0ABX5QQ45_9BACT|nr:[Fe-Fe] hydrogenase large subunit C-terminal domain-containing protein [Fervidobacterium changbaicum]QAV32597.1 ferredoxin [Fervidobacterium changbaicum]SDH34062.1 Iron only hydrogenase large subunit, C-terminal domain [Fervidobacterium changbaicum]
MIPITKSRYILSDKANCTYCYKCLRNCPVKAISFKNEESFVIEEECILCGTCVNVCPQNAKQYRRDINEFLSLVRKPFVLSLAPSFYAYFTEPFKVLTLLKQIGCVYISETSIGAEYVTKEYMKVFAQSDRPQITTACPVVVELVEKYFSEYVDYLIKVKSPAGAHAQFLSHLFGNLPKVFVSPCIAKKKELEGVYDVVLTYEELENALKSVILQEEKNEEDSVSLDDLIEKLSESYPDAPYPNRARFYPSSGGIVYSATSYFNETFPHYVLEGVENIISFFKTFSDFNEKVFIEASACVGGCINGPTMKKQDNILFRRVRLQNAVKRLEELSVKKLDMFSVPVDLKRSLKVKKVEYNVPESEIERILSEMGKTEPSKILNCTGCGYETCREKAVAVAVGKAEKEMCFAYLVEKVSSVSNLVVEETPNAIVIFKESNILYINNSAKELFSSYSDDMIISICLRAKESPNRIHELYINSRKVYLYPKVFDLPDNGGTVVLFVDLTEMVHQREHMNELRRRTIEKIDEVLNEQMKLAQDIASLLGESIAETKSRFAEFKKFLGEENADK